MSNDSFGTLRQRNSPKTLAAIFILFTAALVALISLYWVYTLEPSLKNNAVTSSTVLAQVHGKFIANALSHQKRDIETINADIEEILLLTNLESRSPFVLGIVIELESAVAQSLNIKDERLSYGAVECNECFVTDIALFNPNTRELVGIAKFYSNSIVYRSMVDSVRIRLFVLTFVVLLLLLVVWKSVSLLVHRIGHGERKLYQVFDTAPFPMLLVDYENQYIVQANRSANEQLSVSSGTPLSQLEKSLREALKEVSQNGVVRNKEILTPQMVGKKIGCAIVSATSLGAEADNSIIVGLVDITSIREAQIALETARQKAEMASNAKSEFLATMSHEIRTPMNGILGMVQLLQRSEISEYQREYIDAISRSGESLLVILNDILDFSRMEANHLELKCEDFDIDMLLDDLSSLIKPVASEKGLLFIHHVDDHVPRYLYGDVARLRQILLNLVGNAVKFTTNGKIEVNITIDKQADDDTFLLYVSVSDTGIGIPAEMHNSIFERFVQGDQSASRRYGGSGLGLTIAKGLVGLMGGDISIQSTPGIGSTFNFHVRVQSATRAGTIKEVKAFYRKPQRKLMILVVEDVAINRRVVKGLLDTEGHQVIEATNGEEAVTIASATHFDAILMDLQMPVLDGYEAARLIRAGNGLSNSSPIIALTANILQDEQHRCISVGMSGFIVKPFTLSKLNDELARVTE